ncbi:uncharacterized protein PV09_04508 [Verruconis gallopava]|uniref:Xylanolytic transcriptional activator regulatory domain-containing protein n=1 Tax=Verruconis gallopava TaxID=253628 RepID=A0A0D2ACH3_9PEZI|nr:uncharacterized protein PV09_04508 [Verruconis gallopava]KIW04200.1 hypothetical protein PV09_04508 [Verruconis gallopava]
MLLGLLLRTFEDSEHILSSLLQHSLREPALILGEGEPSSGSALDTWRKSGVFKLVGSLLSLVQSSDDEENSPPTIDESLTTALSAFLNCKESAGNVHQLSTPESLTSLQRTQRANTATTPPVVSGNFTPTAGLFSPDPSILPPNWLKLLEDYIATTHCWFLISKKHELLQIAYTAADAGRCIDQPCSGDLAFLWAVFAYSTRQNESESAFGVESDCENIAFSLIYSRSQSYGFGHVRALLLLTLLKVATESWSAAWVLLGQALYLATDLGIISRHRDGSGLSTYQNQLEDSQRRLFHGCFILDTLISTHLKRQSLLTWSDLQSVGPIDIEGLEEWEPWKPPRALNIRSYPCKMLSTFNSFVELVGLLNYINTTAEVGSTESQIETIQQQFSALKERLSSQIHKMTQEGIGIFNQPYQFLNLQFAISGIQLKVHQKMSSVSGAVFGSQEQHLTSSFRLFREQSRGTNKTWKTPLLKIYIALFDEQLAMEPALCSENDLLAWKSILLDIVSHFQSDWQGKPDVPHTSSDILPKTVTVPKQSVLPPSTSHLTQPISPNSMMSCSAFTDPTSVVDAVVTQTPMDPDESSLFDSLAMLDSVLCPFDSPRFLEHLGMAPNQNPVDFSAISDLDRIA